MAKLLKFLDGRFEPSTGNRMFNIAYEHGIKDVSLPEDVKLNEYTHFVLPSFKSLPGVFANEFMEFWPRLDDIHKERQLLVGFMCTLRSTYDFLTEVKTRNVFPSCDPEQLKNPDLDSDRINLTALLCECESDCIWTMRRLFIDEQHQRRQLLYVINQFLTTFENNTLPNKKKLLKEFFAVPFQTARARVKRAELPDWVLGYIGGRVVGTFYGTQILISGWISTSRPTEIETAEARDRYLAKLKAAVPHWRPEDRAYLLLAVETNGNSCLRMGTGTYVHKLIEAVGMEQFKLIAFGKEKFCATCTQSTFTAATQLLACKHCDREGIRPRARYCNTDCQRAHWIKHKADFHACYNCKCIPAPDQGRLRACMRCIEEKIPIPARYCGVSCQKADWKKHKAIAHAGPKEA